MHLNSFLKHANLIQEDDEEHKQSRHSAYQFEMLSSQNKPLNETLDFSHLKALDLQYSLLRMWCAIYFSFTQVLLLDIWLPKKIGWKYFKMLLSSHLYLLLDFCHYSKVNNKSCRVRVLRPKDIIILLLELNVPPKMSSVTGIKWCDELADYLLKLSL